MCKFLHQATDVVSVHVCHCLISSSEQSLISQGHVYVPYPLCKSPIRF
jgi:hypothetical protein